MDKVSVQYKIELTIMEDYDQVIAIEQAYFEMIYKYIMAKL